MMMKHIKDYFFILIFGLFLFIVLLPYYQGGRIISGGEGSYFLDFPLFWQNYGYTWFNAGTGVFATSLNFGFVSHLVLLQTLIPNEKVVNFIMIYLIYFLPFLAVYLLSRELKLKPPLAFLMSSFYLTNPFMLNFLKSINQWNMLVAYILPSFFLIILRFYDRSLKLFLLFGINSLIFAFTNANPPTMIVSQMATALFVFYVSFYKEQKINPMLIIKKYFLVVSSFVLFNFWWIINWFYIFIDVQRGYTTEFAISWLKWSNRSFIPAFWQVLNLAAFLGYPISSHYSHLCALVLLPIPIMIVVYSLFKKKLVQKHYLVLGLILLVVGFLAKGARGALGVIYELMAMYMPLFSIFKTPYEKWGVLFVFLLTLYLIFVFNDFKKERFYAPILTFFTIYVLYFAYPFLTSNFIPDYKYNEQVTSSRRFLDKSEYQNLRKKLNSDPGQYRVLSLPGSLNYQVALRIEEKRFYTGMDPILNNINKPFVASYGKAFTQNFYQLFDAIAQPKYLNLLGIYNIKKIVINKDMYPWFGFKEKETIPEIEEILDKSLASSKNEAIDLYDVGDYFLPRFYIADKIIYSPTSTQRDLPRIVEADDFSPRTALFINPDETAENVEKVPKPPLVDEIRVKLDNRISEEKLGLALKEISLPSVHWDPKSLFYPFILKREEYDKWKVRGKPEKLFEKHLFYANKRISELEKFAGDADGEIIVQMTKGYQKEIEKAFEVLEELRQAEEENTPIHLTRLKRMLWSHQKEASSFNLGDETKEKIADIFTDWEKSLDELGRRDFSNLVYNFEIPQAGRYKIYLKDQEGEWFLETKEFEKGSQQLILPISGISENLIDQNLKINNYLPDSIYRISFDYQTSKGTSFFIAETKTGKIAETFLLPTGENFKHFEMFFKSSSEVTGAVVHLAISQEMNLRVECLFQPQLVLRSIKEIKEINGLMDYSKKVPKITFVKINPTKYRVKVEGAREPYTLVFSESFHKGWKAYINRYTVDTDGYMSRPNVGTIYEGIVASYFDGEIKEGTHKNIFLDRNTFETWGKEPLPEERHFFVNAYANSWYITPQDSGGEENYEIIVEYEGQRLFYIGLGISLITLAGSLRMLIGTQIMRRETRRRRIKSGER